MPILPLIDLLILMGSASLVVGFVLKASAITTHYRPSILGFSSIDMVIIAGICLGFALTLAARTWVKLNEPRLLAFRRRASEAELRWQAEELEQEAEAARKRGRDDRPRPLLSLDGRSGRLGLAAPRHQPQRVQRHLAVEPGGGGHNFSGLADHSLHGSSRSPGM